MIDHIDNLFVKQPWIYGVANGAHAGNAKIKLEMAVPVPGDGGDTVACYHAEFGQRLGLLF